MINLCCVIYNYMLIARLNTNHPLHITISGVTFIELIGNWKLK